MSIAELQDRLSAIHEENQSILAMADAEKRDLTGEEQEKLDALIDEFNIKKADIARMQAVQEHGSLLAGSQGRRSDPEPPRAQADDDADSDDAPSIRPTMSAGPRARREPQISVVDRNRGRWGWRNFGEFANAVRHGSVHGGVLDNRLSAQMAPSTYGQEGVGSDGGFAVPPDFRADIISKVFGEEQLIAKTDQSTCSGNSVTLPVDTTTPWQSSGGILAYWDGEAQQFNQSKPAIEQVQLKLNKLTALVPVSEELMEDVPALDAFLRRKAPEKMNMKMNTAIVQGTGVGQPLGILNAPSLKTVADANGGYIEPLDIFNMWSAMYAPYRSTAVWLVHQTVEKELMNMHIKVQNAAANDYVGGVPVWLPGNNIAGAPYMSLMGRPVISTEACKPLNTPGDILFVNLGQYMTVTKGGGIRTDTSMHLFFDYAVTAYRFIFRVAGRPMWDSTITASDGSSTYSWAVALDTRT